MSIFIFCVDSGSALSSNSLGAPVPSQHAPVAFWLFGTALVGLVGFTRRKKANTITSDEGEVIEVRKNTVVMFPKA